MRLAATLEKEILTRHDDCGNRSRGILAELDANISGAKGRSKEVIGNQRVRTLQRPITSRCLERHSRGRDVGELNGCGSCNS
jgi:hypothetical protein